MDPYGDRVFLTIRADYPRVDFNADAGKNTIKISTLYCMYEARGET